VLKSETMRATLGADYYVSSMRDTVVQCLKVATGEEVLPEAATSASAAQASEPKRVPLPA
jgi:hypothetical protein